MLIVCDTGPLRYLTELQVADVLPLLYGTVMTTPLVLEELQMAHFPEPVKSWAESPPKWLEIHNPTTMLDLDLDSGELSAISLADERKADRVLIDERKAAALATARGLTVTGTLGVLANAGALHHLDFNNTLETLTLKTRFRYTPAVITEVRRYYKELLRDLEKQRG